MASSQAQISGQVTGISPNKSRACLPWWLLLDTAYYTRAFEGGWEKVFKDEPDPISYNVYYVKLKKHLFQPIIDLHIPHPIRDLFLPPPAPASI